MVKNDFARKNQIVYTLNNEEEKLLQIQMDKIVLVAGRKWPSRREAHIECIKWFVKKYGPIYLKNEQ